MNSWYLRKPDGKEFGPESIKTLVKWAEQSRIIAGNEISKDKKNWQLVENVTELDICYIAILPDKSIYGPFNIRATHDLIEHKVFTKDTTIVNKRNGEEIVAADFLKQKRKKAKTSKPISGQSDFELLSSPESELQSNVDKSEDKKSNKSNIASQTEKKKILRDKMDSKKQEFLFNDEDDFQDDLQYVVDEDAQIEMPFEEEPTVVYNGEKFPAPTQNNTIFISKDNERFPELVTKKTILSIDDVQPAEDQRQTKLFEGNTKENDPYNHLDQKNKSIPEEVDDNDAEATEKKDNPKTETTHDSHKNDTELDDLKQSLETTTKLFVEQQTKDREKIKILTAERNGLEQDIANSSDSIKNLKELNQTLELSLKESKQQLKQLFEQVNEKDDIIKNLKTEKSKFLNGLDVSKEEINELIESKKDLSLALAAERDKLKKQEKLTLEYQNKLDENEEKHNKILEDYTEKNADLLEEKQSLENTKENLINNNKNLEAKIKDMETDHVQITKNLEEKLIAIRLELKAEEELKENFKKEVKELQSKIKSTDTIVNERMRSINEQTTRISTKYKQECRLTEKLAAANKKLIITIAVLILIILLGAILYVFPLKSRSKQLESTNIQKGNISQPALIVKDDITPSHPLLSENISLVGAKTLNEGKLVKVVFDEAMFSKLSSLSAFAIKNTRANLAEYKKYLKDYDMVIEGHTDDSPMTDNSKYKDNKELGLARAESFKNLLVVSFGIPAENISTVSAGSHKPPFNNSTPEGREKNKTVVLYFKNK